MLNGGRTGGLNRVSRDETGAFGFVYLPQRKTKQPRRCDSLLRDSRVNTLAVRSPLLFLCTSDVAFWR